LQERIEFHTQKLAEEPVFEQKIGNLQQNYEALKKQYASLLDKKQAADLSYALEVRQKAERFVVLDAAKAPQKPAAPNRTLISFAGFMGGLLLGMAFAAIAEMNDEAVRSESEAARILGKPVLSGIPRLVSAQERRILWVRAAAVLVCTVLGSSALGLLLSVVAGRFF
jgi:hypothetical protein